jgi:hypothetical protein
MDGGSRVNGFRLLLAGETKAAHVTGGLEVKSVEKEIKIQWIGWEASCYYSAEITSGP